jgi:hypothetical protein
LRLCCALAAAGKSRATPQFCRALPPSFGDESVWAMKTKHYVLQIFRAAFTDRLLLIIVMLMIAAPFSILPIKSCSNPGPTSDPGSTPSAPASTPGP